MNASHSTISNDDVNCSFSWSNLMKLSSFLLSTSPKKYPQSVELIYVLLEELKKRFTQSSLLLTSTFFVSTNFLSQCSDVKKDKIKDANDYIGAVSVASAAVAEFEFNTFARPHDFLILMPVNYDKYHSINDTIKELHILNVEQKVNNLIGLGVPAEKIVFGITFGGPLFTKKSPTVAFDAHAVLYSKIVNYNFICEKLMPSTNEQTKWQTFYDNDSALNIAYDYIVVGVDIKSKKEENQQIIVFADGRSVAKRVSLLMEKNLAGAAAITVDMDYYYAGEKCGIDDKHIFNDFTGMTQSAVFNMTRKNETTFPFLQTINNAIVLATNIAAERKRIIFNKQMESASCSLLTMQYNMIWFLLLLTSYHLVTIYK